jgi:hypothetical protein
VGKRQWVLPVKKAVVSSGEVVGHLIEVAANDVDTLCKRYCTLHGLTLIVILCLDRFYRFDLFIIIVCSLGKAKSISIGSRTFATLFLVVIIMKEE